GAVGAVTYVGGAQNPHAVAPAPDGDGGAGPTPCAGGAAGGPMRHGGRDGHAVTGGFEALDQRRPAPLRRSELRGVVMGQQQDPHPAVASPGPAGPAAFRSRPTGPAGSAPGPPPPGVCSRPTARAASRSSCG